LIKYKNNFEKYDINSNHVLYQKLFNENILIKISKFNPKISKNPKLVFNVLIHSKAKNKV
jgi:hypothetical protein